MSIDWQNLLRGGMHGVAVEGKDDQVALEAFLSAGERDGHWQNWRARLAIQRADGTSMVLKEVQRTDYIIWGILDRDWRTQEELADLQQKHPRLLFLPRIMIENFILAPDDLMARLPPAQRTRLEGSNFKTSVEAERTVWIQHGALSGVLYERGAHQFCRGEEGFPRRLLAKPVSSKDKIKRQLEVWQAQLAPESWLPIYEERLVALQSQTATDQYSHCIDGKDFFNEVVVRQLNRFLGQFGRDKWWEILFQHTAESPPCPPDLVPLLKRLLAD
ncbi:MAG: hypothetical protein DYG88_11575 [Chloroflexi bacterium CFX4]|nr:hypothetical protein [Chloroflexi bacterium CFX4]MDL1923014.1 hypothetical protein [Chloroflexi bacterium CFX3]